MMPSVRSILIGGCSRPSSGWSVAFSRPRGPSSAVNAAATTTVGITNGTVAMARSSDLPGNS